MVDTHAHVHDRQYDEDRVNVLERARAAGVERIVTIGCDIDDSRRALRVAEQFGLAATVGIHPHEAKDAPADLVAAFDELRDTTHATVVAIGETGLDYYYEHSPPADQRRVMEAQIVYARRAGLPVVFHQRDAFDDFVAVLRAAWDRTRMRGVVHCFTGSAEEAHIFIDEFGLKLGIGRGLIGVVVAELFGSRAGLGRLISQSADAFNMPELFAGVVVLAVAGIVMTAGFGWLEKRLVPWTKD